MFFTNKYRACHEAHLSYFLEYNISSIMMNDDEVNHKVWQ